MIFGTVRWFATSFAFHLAVTYAAFLALKRPGDLNILKLWVMLSVITAISYLLGDFLNLIIPVYLEMRVILVWGIILLEPVGWSDLYDKICQPLIAGVLTYAKGVSNSGLMKMSMLFLADGSLRLADFSLSVASEFGAIRDSERVNTLVSQLHSEVQSSKQNLKSPLAVRTHTD